MGKKIQKAKKYIAGKLTTEKEISKNKNTLLENYKQEVESLSFLTKNPADLIFQKVKITLEANEKLGEDLMKIPKEELEQRDPLNRTPLFFAVKDKNVSVVKYISKKVGTNISHQNQVKSNILHVAARSGDSEVLKILLEKTNTKQAKEAMNQCNYLQETPIKIITDKHPEMLSIIPEDFFLNEQTFPDLLGDMTDSMIV